MEMDFKTKALAHIRISAAGELAEVICTESLREGFTRITNSAERTRFHESGHAVVAILSGVPFKYVCTCFGNPFAEGFVKFSDDLPLRDDGPSDEEKIRCVSWLLTDAGFTPDMDALRHEAEEMLRSNWGWVARVASALIEKQSLDMADVEALRDA
jgi:hypothetical protein